MTTTYKTSEYRETIRQIMAVIAARSAQTKLHFPPHYILLLAFSESSMNRMAYSSKSTAAGLYQFIIDTWTKMWQEKSMILWQSAQRYLTMALDNQVAGSTNPINQAIQEYGDRLISPTMLGLSGILNARTDPYWSTTMAIELTNANANYVNIRVENPISESPGMLYLAHHFGCGTAVKLINAGPDANPHTVISNWDRVVASNPQLENLSAGEVNAWAYSFIMRGQDWLLKHVGDLFSVKMQDLIFKSDNDTV